MAFFDNLGKRASVATAKAVQKAQEFSEVTRLNSLISDEEKKVNDIYYQIGKLYMSVHGNDGEDGFSDMIVALSEAEQNIQIYQKQILEVKGVQRCEKCGAETPKGVSFCSACGTAIPKADMESANNSILCDSCGAAVNDGTNFCTSCGNPITKTENGEI